MFIKINHNTYSSVSSLYQDILFSVIHLINDNLQRQAQTIYQKMFLVNSPIGRTKGVLSDIATVTMGQSPDGSSYNEDGNGMIFFQGKAEFGFRFPAIHLCTTEPQKMALKNDVLMSVRAPVGTLNVAHENCCIGRGLGAIHSKDHHQSFVLYTMFTLKHHLDLFNGEGTVFGAINQNALNSLPIWLSSKDGMDKFEKIVNPIDAAIWNYCDEICSLRRIRDTMLSKLRCNK